MQAEPFAPSHPHPNLQPFEPIQAKNALAIDPPAFTSQQNVDAQVTEARTTQCNLANARQLSSARENRAGLWEAHGFNKFNSARSPESRANVRRLDISRPLRGDTGALARAHPSSKVLLLLYEGRLMIFGLLFSGVKKMEKHVNREIASLKAEKQDRLYTIGLL
jgi:hypothetical protein